MSAASGWNSSFLATKSVSQLSSISAPSAAATRPLLAVRSAPRFLHLGLALDAQELDGLVEVAVGLLEGLLASIIPAPVASRSFLTSAAVKFAMSFVSLVDARTSGQCSVAGVRRRGRRRSDVGGSAARASAASGGSPRLRPVSAGGSASAASAAGASAAGLGGLGGVRRPRRRLGRGVPRPPCRCSSSRSQSASGSSAAELAGGGLLVAVLAGPRAGHQALGDGVGDDPGEQRDGADRVVVARDLVVDLVRVAVGVEDRDDRDVQLARLADGDVLLLGVDDPDRARDPRPCRGCRRGSWSSLSFSRLQDEQLLLGHARAGHVVEVELLELLEALQPLVHGLEVGEHAAEPALVDVGHADAGRLLGDRLLGLLLGADEQDRAAVGDGLLDELVGAVDVGQRLLQVDDVDAVALGEDEALHLRVPATGLVPEVDAALEQLLHGDDLVGHVCLSCAEARGASGSAMSVPSRVTGRPLAS